MVVFLGTSCTHSHQRLAPLDVPPGMTTSAARYNQEGIQHFNQRRWDLAKQHFEQAVKVDPRLAQAHYNLGLVLREQGNQVESRSHFLEAADLAPGDPIIWNSPVLAPYGDVQKPPKPGSKPVTETGGHGH